MSHNQDFANLMSIDELLAGLSIGTRSGSSGDLVFDATCDFYPSSPSRGVHGSYGARNHKNFHHDDHYVMSSNSSRSSSGNLLEEEMKIDSASDFRSLLGAGFSSSGTTPSSPSKNMNMVQTFDINRINGKRLKPKPHPLLSTIRELTCEDNLSEDDRLEDKYVPERMKSIDFGQLGVFKKKSDLPPPVKPASKQMRVPKIKKDSSTSTSTTETEPDTTSAAPLTVAAPSSNESTTSQKLPDFQSIEFQEYMLAQATGSIFFTTDVHDPKPPTNDPSSNNSNNNSLDIAKGSGHGRRRNSTVLSFVKSEKDLFQFDSALSALIHDVGKENRTSEDTEPALSTSPISHDFEIRSRHHHQKNNQPLCILPSSIY